MTASATAATKSRKLNGAASMGGAAFTFSFMDDDSAEARASSKRRIAANVAEALTIGIGASATSAITSMLITALTVSIGAFFAMAIAIAFAILALTATFMAGGIVRQAVTTGVVDKWYQHLRGVVTSYAR